MQGVILHKQVSATLSLSSIPDLNGRLGVHPSRVHLERDVSEFLREKYSGSCGTLEISFQNDTVNLRWLPDRVDADAESLHREAVALARKKNYRDAVNRWVRAIALNPDDPDYYFNLGIAFFELKNYQESIENLEKAVQICPIYAKAHLILGTVYLKTRKFQEGERHLRESVAFSPGNALAHLNLGAIYSILKKYDKGIEMFERALDLNPAEIRAAFGLAKIYSLTGDAERASRYFRKVIEMDKSGTFAIHAKRGLAALARHADATPAADVNQADLDALYSQGYRAFLFSDYLAAASYYRKYLKASPQDDYVWSALGEAELRSANIDAAVAAFRQAARLDPRKGLYFKQLGIALDYAGRTKEAIVCFRKAESLGKSDSTTHALLGKNLFEEGQHEQAVRELEESLRLNRTNLLAKYYLALTLQKLGEIDLARSHLRDVASVSVNSPLKREAERLIKDWPD